MLERESYVALWRELAHEKSMILLSGPRQAGKTTLAGMIAKEFSNSVYFNWDVPHNKAQLLENPYFFEEIKRKDETPPLVILDEIHKYKEWKNYLKGIYDHFHDTYRFLVLGSGRLDLYRKGGDSLAGRYFLFRLWPFTLAELGRQQSTPADFRKNPLKVSTSGVDKLKNIWGRLSSFSGFPEPYLTGKAASFRRWSNTYSQQLIREDIRDMTGIKSVDDMEILYSLLPSKVGSPLSLNSLAQDLKVSYNTVKDWMSIFQRFYMTFSLPTWTSRIARAIQKEKKVYLLNYALIKDPASRFENMVALELLRAVSRWNDLGHGNFSLHFIKDKEKREVDFLIAEDGEPVLLVETKLSDSQPAPSLIKFQKHLNVPAVQLTDEGKGHRIRSNAGQKLVIVPAWQWIPHLP